MKLLMRNSLLLSGAAGLLTAGQCLAQDTLIYGYTNAYVEKVDDTPIKDENGKTDGENNPHEFDIPNINAMIQSSFDHGWKSFLNLKAPGAEGVEVSNAWVEGPLYGNIAKIRFGKLYRRFGLYNEILDAVPTYIGIEPPELFDKDHLMLTRTTNLMLHGNANFSGMTLTYSFTTGNDEKEGDQMPLGADLRLSLGMGLTIGTSYYNTNGWAVPSKEPGEGSPDGGVLNWMARDNFSITGGYLEYINHGVTFQVESWTAKHEAERDADKVKTVIEKAGPNERQLKRFTENGDGSTVITEANYDVSTTYVRAGYSIEAGEIEVTPYLQYDIYENPETIQSKKYGGDNEAGLSDDGKFTKYTYGTVIRPNDVVAIKIDASTHNQKYNGEDNSYSEVRGSFSYFWEL